MAKSQPRNDAISRTQSLLSGLQESLNGDSQLRAELSDDLEAISAGSNDHLGELLDVTSSIEDSVNELLCDLSTLQSALDIYGIAGSSCQRGGFDLSEAVSVFSKLLPDHRDWDNRLHQLFTRLHSMKRSIAH